MNESDLEQLVSSRSLDLTAPIKEVLDPLMPFLVILFVLGIVVSVIMVIFFIINTVQKQRQHAAIMRIDRNLQKLVDAQTPPAPAQPVQPTPAPLQDL